MPYTSLIDTHCHLDFADFDKDRPQVIASAHALGVKHMIIPSVTQATWQRTITLCQQYDSLHLALGLHPVFIQQHKITHLNALADLIQQHTPIAVGEIGLDFYTKELQAQQNQQCLFFEQQLSIANEQKLPVIIHNRKAHDECLELLTQNHTKGGIIHAFNGSLQQAFRYIEMGFLLGFGGMLTFERSRKLRNLLEVLPLSSIVMETDAPDMTVKQHQGERNSPEYLPYILQTIVDIKKQPADLITQQLNTNIAAVFDLPLDSSNN